MLRRWVDSLEYETRRSSQVVLRELRRYHAVIIESESQNKKKQRRRRQAPDGGLSREALEKELAGQSPEQLLDPVGGGGGARAPRYDLSLTLSLPLPLPLPLSLSLSLSLCLSLCLSLSLCFSLSLSLSLSLYLSAYVTWAHAYSSPQEMAKRNFNIIPFYFPFQLGPNTEATRIECRSCRKEKGDGQAHRQESAGPEGDAGRSGGPRVRKHHIDILHAWGFLGPPC